MKKWLLRISLIFNILFILGLGLNWINSPSHELGRLEKDLKIGIFTSDSVIFTIPKGLTVRNASERGISAIGQFENERFEIVITSDDPNLVNYKVPKSDLDSFGNFYSADVQK